MTPPVRIFFFSSFAVILLGILSPLLLESFKPEDALPELAVAPKFVLTNSAAAEFSSAELKGRIWLVNFFFTRCTGPCPIQSAAFAKLAKRFAADPQVRLLSISADPEHDTPKELTEYAERFSADTSKWHFLTGEKEEIIRLLNEGFRLGSMENPKFHSTRFVLIDKSGVIRGYYPGTEDETPTRLMKDIRQLKANS